MWGDKLNKDIFLTIKPMKSLKKCCRFGLCPFKKCGSRGSNDKFSASRTIGAEHCLLCVTPDSTAGRGVNIFSTVLAGFSPKCLNYCCLTTLSVCVIAQLFMVLYWCKNHDRYVQSVLLLFWSQILSLISPMMRLKKWVSTLGWTLTSWRFSKRVWTKWYQVLV